MIGAVEAFLAARKAMAGPFAWSQADCATAACDAFQRLWGVDPMDGERACYTGHVSAARRLKEAGGYLAWCDAVFSRNGLCAVADPLPGDLVLLNYGPLGGALSICIRPCEYAGKGRSGFTMCVAPTFQGAWSCRV